MTRQLFLLSAITLFASSWAWASFSDANDDLGTLPHPALLFYPNNPGSLVGYHLEPVILDANNIKGLALMSVEGGHSLANAFGHSTMRIFMQDGRDLVLSFKAHITEQQHEALIPIKGVIGSFPSRVFLTPLEDFLAEYLEQGRHVIIFPINATPEQIALLVDLLPTALDTEKPYTFFSNNCARALWKLMELFMLNTDMHESSPISPSGVIKSMKKVGLIDKKHKKHASRRIGKLWKMEESGLAFVAYGAKRKFFYKSIVNICASENISVPWTLSDLEQRGPLWRLVSYRRLFNEFKQLNRPKELRSHILTLIVMMTNIEGDLERVLCKNLKSAAMAPQNDSAFARSEKTVGEIGVAVKKWIEDHGHHATITTQEELHDCQAIQREMVDIFAENWVCKRRLKILENHELDHQKRVFKFLTEQFELYRGR
jgi:hypothetical protein